MIKDSPFQQPDVSEVTPIYVPVNSTRSYLVDIIYINDYGTYQRVKGYWDNVDKLWREHNGLQITNEVVRTERNQETIKHHTTE